MPRNWFLHRGGDDALRMHQFGELVKARIRHRDGADIRLDGTEREVGCLCFRVAQTVEECALAYVR